MNVRCWSAGSFLLSFTWLSVLAGAAPQVLWQGEAAKLVRPASLRFGAAVVDDANAGGGKAVRVPWSAEAKGWSVEFAAPKLTLQGRVEATFLLRGEGMLPLSDPLLIHLITHDEKTGIQARTTNWPVYGINLKPDGYTAVTLSLETTPTPTVYRDFEVLLEWRVSTPNRNPVVFLDRVELRAEAADHAAIAEVWPGKVRYEPGERATVRVTVSNPTARAIEASLEGSERHGLASERKAFGPLAVSLPAGASKDVTAEWKLGPEEYGREIAVRLVQDGHDVDRASELFAVSRTPLRLSTGNGYDQAQPAGDMHTIFYVEPTTPQQSWKSIRFFKKKSPGGDCFEFFSWSPGDISDQAPEEDPFPGGEGRMVYRSKQTIIEQNKLLRSVGMWPVSYVNGTCWAESGYKLFARHPEWFLYDANGEVAHYEMDRRELYRRKDMIDFEPEKYTMIFFQATLNHSLPAVQEYIASQYVRCARVMGFCGVRMDVRYLEVYPGERGFDGKEVAPTHAAADRLSAAAVKRVKALVHKEIPEFTFGYNYASPEEVKNMPLTMQERCAGAGWMLDEVSCGYQEKTSPYHVWSAYLPRMVSWGNQVNQWDGIYNPFDFRRGGAKYAVDNIYSSIFRLIAGGRFGCYLNSRLPFGNLGRLATRHSELFFGRERRWVQEVKGEVEVAGDAPLWWKDAVFWNRDTQGRQQLIVNLINPPKAAEIEENPRSEVNPPVTNVRVVCAPQAGKAPRAAYLVTGEPDEPTGRPALRTEALKLEPAANGRVTVTVPSVIFWKMVVFEY